MSNAVLDQRDWPVMTTSRRTGLTPVRRAALTAVGAGLLALAAVTCAVGALVPDILASVPERALFGLVSLVTLAGAVTLVVDLSRGRHSG